MSTDDPTAVRADDKLFDALGAGEVPDGDPVTTKLAEWRAGVDAEPIPDPPAAPVITHDDLCEAEYIGPAGSLTDCGCAERAAYPVIHLPGSTADTAGDRGQATDGDLARVIADRLTGNELLPGRWVILDATPVDDVITLRVITWGSSLGPSPRTETCYTLKLDRYRDSP